MAERGDGSEGARKRVGPFAEAAYLDDRLAFGLVESRAIDAFIFSLEMTFLPAKRVVGSLLLREQGRIRL